MKTAVIACNVLRDQIESMGEFPHKFIYLEQGLHRTPKTLHEQLQETIDSLAEFEVLLLGYGLCSRSVIGLKGKPYQTIIIPRIDDCIGISMGKRARFYEIFSQHPGTYYFTRGWVEAAEDTLKEYHKTVAKYGEEIAEWTSKECLKHYERTVFIQTSEEVHQPSREYAQEFARFFNLSYEEMMGSDDFIRKLLQGPWDEDFVLVRAGNVVQDEMFNQA